jgi:hypothetical protein
MYFLLVSAWWGCSQDTGGPPGDTSLPDLDPGAYWLVISEQEARTRLRAADGTVHDELVHDTPPGLSTHLMPGGKILRAAAPAGEQRYDAHWDAVTGGQGGLIERWNWEGEREWSFQISDGDALQHHDVFPMPNGNVLALVWEFHTDEDVIAKGRTERLRGMGIWTDAVWEIQPSGAQGGEVVWRWSSWDHTGEGPRRIDLSAGGLMPDWSHANAVTYHEGLDQVAVSVRGFSEIWVIDHGTTTEEAAGGVGGRRGFGGDLLYRWGNPAAYGAGSEADQQLFFQHDVRWVPEGTPGAGRMTVFNNGPIHGSSHSAFTEWTPPLLSDGTYELVDGRFGPDAPDWTWTEPEPTDFFEPFMSGAVRLPSGNTLLTGALSRTLREVSPEGEVVARMEDPYPDMAPFERVYFRSEVYPVDGEFSPFVR